jgi:precorrin-2 dehydrogenase / sirohydrochlorin ferrochelatase
MAEMIPLLFTLKNKKVMIIGGGNIAFRKAKALVNSGASITIISPGIIEEFNTYPSIKWLKKRFEPEDVKEAHIIFAATNDKEINQFVKNSTTEFQWFNDVSNQENSDFHTPAIVRRGDLIVSVSTSGKSPVLTKKIKNELENFFDHNVDKIVVQYADMRKKTRQ